MFERRLKIFLTAIIAMAALMLVRAVQLQILQHGIWQTKADDANRRRSAVETPRGEIVDRNGVRLAFDDACIDAAVDYRAISMDADWIKAQARARLPKPADMPPGLSRDKLLADEIERVKVDIDSMWIELAEASGKTTEELEEIKTDIRRRVDLLRRNALYKRFGESNSGESSSSWLRWLVDAGTNDPEQQRDAALAANMVVVGEETQGQVILPNIGNDLEIRLRKQLDRFPGLELRKSTHRQYASLAAIAACHILGHVSPVAADDVKSAANVKADPLRKYLPRDNRGRAGIESLAEPILRGSRGQMLHSLGKREPVIAVQPIPGAKAFASIDIELQAKVLEFFKTVIPIDANGNKEEPLNELHGAAVVIDVRTSEVLVMASYPTFNLNTFDADYAAQSIDESNQPLLNRATMAQCEPGSTVKPEIGAVAVTQGIIRYDEGIPCTGYLVYHDYVNNREVRIAGTNRCWVANMFNAPGHTIPPNAPFTTSHGNPYGYLSVADALERSCNVFFQTVADRMHVTGVVAALSRFGLGRPTGIGIPESAGRLPTPSGIVPKIGFEIDSDRRAAWLAGIGQGQVAATPLQMANVAATLARNGIWRRPRLLTGESAKAIYDRMPGDTVDLNLSELALTAVRDGMKAVTQNAAGTGRQLYFPQLKVAGKTGSAQVGRKSIHVRDSQGHLIPALGADGKPDPTGRPLRHVLEPGRKGIRESEVKWFYMTVNEKSEHLAHAWYIGYAPADNPQIAFAVLVEYGGGGGTVAGAVAREVVQACSERGYLPPTGR